MGLSEVSPRLQSVFYLGLDLVGGPACGRYIAHKQHSDRSVVLNGVLAVQFIGPEHFDFEPISRSEMIA